MGKYKVCPNANCGAHNSPALIECLECGADLTSVRVVDEETEKVVQNEKSDIEPQGEIVRICECGMQNPPQARKCASCGEDVSDIQPVLMQNSQHQFVLSILDGSYAYEITKPVCTVGREQEMKEYLISKPYVSRTHAKITLVENELYISNLSKTNFTYVNNKKIEDDIPHLLHDGDEIGLGGLVKDGTRQDEAAYFAVRICPCT